MDVIYVAVVCSLRSIYDNLIEGFISQALKGCADLT